FPCAHRAHRSHPPPPPLGPLPRGRERGRDRAAAHADALRFPQRRDAEVVRVRILALDTSTPTTSCALLEDDRVVREQLVGPPASCAVPRERRQSHAFVYRACAERRTMRWRASPLHPTTCRGFQPEADEMRKYKVAIAGATGAVGREMIKVLEEREFPVGELVPLASERSEGQQLEFGGDAVVVRRLKPDSFAGVDIALFSPGATVSREFAPHAARA